MKRLADRQQRRARRFGFWAAVVAIAGYLLFAGDQRPHHLLLLWLEDRRTEERIDRLEAERNDLRAQADRLASDTLALETLAREKGMIRPGDLVYRIVPVPPDVREAAAESLAARAARQAADSLAAMQRAERARKEAAARSRDAASPPPYPTPIDRPRADPLDDRAVDERRAADGPADPTAVPGRERDRPPREPDAGPIEGETGGPSGTLDGARADSPDGAAGGG